MGQFLINHADQLGQKLIEHIYLSLSATVIAILIGAPLGIWITRQPRIRGFVLGMTSIFQTIPSLALLAFLIPFLGIGIKPTIVALTVYALLPITRNTFTGLEGVSKNAKEAAFGLGFSSGQRLRMVELPLALPVIIAGIRTATAMTIGITTIAAFIGAGGLGDFITQGLSLDDTRLILLGAIPAALLALVVDFIIAQIEVSLSRPKRQDAKHRKIKFTIMIILALLLLGFIVKSSINKIFNSHKNTVVVATKNFTEQYILGYLIADMIEAKTNLKVIEKFNLGSTMMAQSAITRGAIDIYPEYTGTAYVVVLKHKKILNANETFKIVKTQYEKRFGLIWLDPFGFENSETLAVRQDFAKQYHLTTLSDLVPLAPKLTLAVPAAFLIRADGLPGLQRVYHFQFKKILQVEPNLMYQAIKNKDVDAIEAFTTDGRLSAYHLLALKDDKHFYPPYFAAIVIREATLKKYPQIKTALAPLAGLINDKTMQKLNAEVDVYKRQPQTVARNFLIKKGLIRSIDLVVPAKAGT